MIIIFSVSTNMVLRILRCEAEITQICTPGEDSLLIAGTILGSLYLYDLNEFDQMMQSRSEELDYDALLLALSPDMTP